MDKHLNNYLSTVSSVATNSTLSIEEFILKYKNDPDLRKIPLPDYVYEKYNISKPEILPLNTYLLKNMRTSIMGGSESEIRGPDDKGVRQLPELPKEDLSGNLV